MDARYEFRFERCLGRGGFADVYLAEMARRGGLRRRVAVKVVREGLDASDQAVRRLRDEELLAELRHPAILAVQELTWIEGRLALVSEYVEGLDASSAVEPSTRWPARVVVGLLGEVASALHCAYTTVGRASGEPLHLVHRDIKPENIRLSKFGEVKLLDFGIARAVHIDRLADTEVGDMPFTPGYAAPESFNSAVQTHQTDIYALGVTLFRMLVGERLHEGVPLKGQIALAADPARYEAFVRSRLLSAELGDELRALLADMLAFNPMRRPGAGEVASHLAVLAESLSGPPLVTFARNRWSGSVRLPTSATEARSGDLTGRTVVEGEDGPTDTPAPRTQASPAPPRPAVEPDLAFALGQSGLIVLGMSLLSATLVLLVVLGVLVVTRTV